MQEELDTYHEQLAKAYLDHVRDCSTRIQLINEEIEQLKGQLTLSGVTYSEHVNGGSVHKDAIPDGVARMFELIEEYTTQQVEYIEEQKVFHDILMGLNRTEALLIQERWINGRTLKEVADKLCYSTTSISTIQKRALQSVYEVMPSMYKETAKAI